MFHIYYQTTKKVLRLHPYAYLLTSMCQNYILISPEKPQRYSSERSGRFDNNRIRMAIRNYVSPSCPSIIGCIVKKIKIKIRQIYRDVTDCYAIGLHHTSKIFWKTSPRDNNTYVIYCIVMINDECDKKKKKNFFKSRIHNHRKTGRFYFSSVTYIKVALYRLCHRIL